LKEYLPPSSVIEVRVMPFSELVRVSAAFGTTAP